MNDKLKVWALESNEHNDLKVFGEDSIEVKYHFDLFIKSLENRGEECIDCHRIAEAQNKEAMIAYHDFISCCGSEDIGREVNGVLYMFGANFGH